MGTVGYFPSSLVEEEHVYQEATKEVPTTVSVLGLRAGQRRTQILGSCSQVVNTSCPLLDVWNDAPPFNEGFLEIGRFGRAIPPFSVLKE